MITRRLVASSVVGVTLVCSIAGLFKWQSDRHNQDTRAREFMEADRLALLRGERLAAANSLGEAYRLGLDSPSLRFMMRQSLAAIDPLTVRIKGQLSFNKATFDASGTRLLTIGREGRAHVWDAVSGRRLFDLGAH